MSVLVVTGGSRGIGAEICRLASVRGWSVCVNYAAAEGAAASVVQEIEAAGGRAISVQGDVADEADIEKVFQADTLMISATHPTIFESVYRPQFHGEWIFYSPRA